MFELLIFHFYEWFSDLNCPWGSVFLIFYFSHYTCYIKRTLLNTNTEICDTICFCVYSQPIIAKEWCSDRVREGDAANTKWTFQIAEWNKVNVYMNSCSFHQCMILPCRHMLRLKEVKQADLCSAEAISERWKLSIVRTFT